MCTVHGSVSASDEQSEHAGARAVHKELGFAIGTVIIEPQEQGHRIFGASIRAALTARHRITAGAQQQAMTFVSTGAVRTSITALAGLVVCAGVCSAYSASLRQTAAAANAPPAVQRPTDLVAQPVSDTGTSSALLPTIVSPRRAAAFGAVTVASLLLLVYVYRRRVYVLQWTFFWLLLAGSLFLRSLPVDYQHSPKFARSLTGFSEFVGICAALVLVLSADSFRQKLRFRREYLAGLLPLLVWFVLAPVALDTRAVVVPGYMISSAVMAAAGLAYLTVLGRRRLLGAGVVGSTLALIAASYIWIAFGMTSGASDSDVSFNMLVMNAVLYVFAALGMHLLVFEDMTYELRMTNRQLATAQQDLRELVITDPLTGCHNRRFFDEVIHHEHERHRRYGIPLSLLFVDVDRFKSINDLHGHEAGDRVLRYVAAFLKRHVREADYVFRWGGDEFLLVLSCPQSEAKRKGADLKEAFLRTAETAGLPREVGLSVGCAEVSDQTTDILELVREADRRMYLDKVAER